MPAPLKIITNDVVKGGSGKTLGLNMRDYVLKLDPRQTLASTQIESLRTMPESPLAIDHEDKACQPQILQNLEATARRSQPVPSLKNSEDGVQGHCSTYPRKSMPEK